MPLGSAASYKDSFGLGHVVENSIPRHTPGGLNILQYWRIKKFMDNHMETDLYKVLFLRNTHV